MRRFISLALSFLILATSVVAAPPVPEVEPNDTYDDAGQAHVNVVRRGAITPAGDTDMYRINGSDGKGVIALLDTSLSTDPGDAILSLIGSDQSTTLGTDSSSWANGPALALTAFADDEDHFLEVKAHPDDATVSHYELRYYTLPLNDAPEVEPNGWRDSGTPSSFSHVGTISTRGDRDCYGFHGRVGDTFLVALSMDESPLDAGLQLIGPNSNDPLVPVNKTGAGGSEILEIGPLDTEGLYAYCVLMAPGSPVGDAATYRVGLVRNGGLYFPAYEYGLTWLNSTPAGVAWPGASVRYRVAVTNTSPVEIPGASDLTLAYPACLVPVEMNPEPTDRRERSMRWDRASALAPGEVFSATVTMRADAMCSDHVSYYLGLAYYETGTGRSTPIQVSPVLFLPTLMGGTASS